MHTEINPKSAFCKLGKKISVKYFHENKKLNTLKASAESVLDLPYREQYEPCLKINLYIRPFTNY